MEKLIGKKVKTTETRGGYHAIDDTVKIVGIENLWVDCEVTYPDGSTDVLAFYPHELTLEVIDE